MVSMLPEASLSLLQEKFGLLFSNLNQEEVQALVTAEIENEVTNQRMQENGLLELRYPDKPNRPDQAYRTVQSVSQPAD